MDVLERIDCDSDDSDASSVMEDNLSNVSSEAEHCNSESSHESVAVSTTSSSDSASIPSSSSSVHNQRAVSLLSVLKPPSASDFSRKRKIARNPAPVGKKTVKSTNSSSNPKTVKPQQRVNEYSQEPFTVASGKLFCQACREELPLKKSSIVYHIKSTKHSEGKKKLQLRQANDTDIAQFLRKYNEDVHGRGETLPEQQQVFRVKVVKTFLQAGVPLSKIEHFRDLFEETGYRLTNKRFLFDSVPFILEQERMRIKDSIKGQFLSVIFHGTSHSGKALAILVRFVNDSWIIKQELLAIQLLSKSLTGEEVAHEMIQVLSVSYSIRGKFSSKSWFSLAM